MAKRAGGGRPRPTDRELEILGALWRVGPATVRQVQAALSPGGKRGPGYTTVLKLMQIMKAKGLLARDDSQKPQVYRSRLGKRETQRQLLADLVQRAFGGSHADLVLQALADRRASEAEMAEIEALLARIEEKRS